MSAIFGDARRTRKRTGLVIRCGSCRKRPATVTLPVSGLRRCQECWDEARGFCELRRDADETPSVAPQPELAGMRIAPRAQPFVTARQLASSVVGDFKRRAGGDQ